MHGVAVEINRWSAGKVTPNAVTWFGLGMHVPIALGVGVTQPQIDALERGDHAAAAFNEAERALLAFGREVVENVRVPESVFVGMRTHFSDQEIVESIFTIGCYMMMARLTEATETDLDPAAGMSVFDAGKKRSA